MNTDQGIAVIIRGVVPVILGLYMTLLAFRVIGRKPGEHMKWDDWHRRYGLLLKVVGPLGILTGVFLTVNVLFFGPPPPSGAWVRASTDDQRVSAEFPEPPQRVMTAVQMIEFHTLTVSVKVRNSSYTLDSSELPEHIRPLGDEEVLDATREAVLEFGGLPGKGCTLVHEEKLNGPGPTGRFFLFSSGEMELRMKVFIFGGRSYRALAANPRNQQGEADGRRFMASVRYEHADK